MNTSTLTNPGIWGESRYIHSPFYDWFWFVLSPLWAIGFGWLMTRSLFQGEFSIFSASSTVAFFFYLSLTQAHLMITVFRTHLNNQVLQRFFWRLTIVPMVVWFAAVNSTWAFALLFALTVVWDVYHSSMQVFGFGRIYDRKAGNNPADGRTADYLLCVLMYTGPVLAGALLMDHLLMMEHFSDLQDIDLFGVLLSGPSLAQLPEKITSFQGDIRTVVLIVGMAIIGLYGTVYLRLRKKGYVMPPQKMAMYLSTSIASIFAWGFNSFAMGFLIANVFHAVQYFALVWSLEQQSIGKVFGAGNSVHAVVLRLALFVCVPLMLGLVSFTIESNYLAALMVTVALMHFWWDGFVWSVQSNKGY